MIQDGRGKGKSLDTSNPFRHAIGFEALRESGEGSTITEAKLVFHEQVTTTNIIYLPYPIS